MNVLVYFLFSHFLKKKQFDLVLQFSFLLFCYQRSFLELLCEQCTHIQLNKKTNNNRPAAFYILIIVIPQCCSPVFAQGICFIWHVKGKIKKRQKENQRLQKKISLLVVIRKEARRYCHGRIKNEINAHNTGKKSSNDQYHQSLPTETKYAYCSNYDQIGRNLIQSPIVLLLTVCKSSLNGKEVLMNLFHIV